MAVDLNNGLTATWNMNSDWLDASGNGRNGTATGATFDTVNQHLGSACGKFDGSNDYVDIANDIALASTDSFTFAAWVKVTDRTIFAPIIARRNAQPTAKGYILSIGGFSGVGEVLFGYQNDTSNRLLRRSGGVISNNTWTLVGGSYDGSKTIGGTHTYISGVQDDGASLNPGTISDVDYSAIPQRLGRDGVNANYFEGLMDTGAMWDRVLNADEWLALYNSGVGVELPVVAAGGIGPLVNSGLINKGLIGGRLVN